METNTNVNTLPVEDGLTIAVEENNFKSKRGRKLMAVVLVFLFILLLVATLFLLQIARPKGDVASGDGSAGVTWIRSIYGYGTDESQMFENPAAVAFDRQGDVIIPQVNSVQSIIVEMTSAGIYKKRYTGSKEGPVVFPSTIEVGPDGKRYFVQGPRDEVVVTNEAGNKSEQVIKVVKPASVAMNTERIAIGARDGFVITDLKGKVIGAPIGGWGHGDREFDTVSGIELDAQNNVYIVDSYNNRISKYDKNGKRLWMVKTGSSGNEKKNAGGDSQNSSTKSAAGLQLPTSACFDGAGRLIVVDPLDFSIAAFDPKDGAFIGKWGTFGQEEGQFVYPSAIAYDPVRDWFAVADMSNNRVQIVRIPGSGTNDTASALARSLTGPIRACLIPIILLILAIILWLSSRARKKKREKLAALLPESSELQGEVQTD